MFTMYLYNFDDFQLILKLRCELIKSIKLAYLGRNNNFKIPVGILHHLIIIDQIILFVT